MSLDDATIVLRIGILVILATISQLAFHRKQYRVMFWSLAFWLTIFRLLTVRVLRVYAHQDDPNLIKFENDLMFGVPALLTDIVLVGAAIPLYSWLVETYKEWKQKAIEIKNGR